VRLAGTPSGPRIFRKQVAATAPGLRPGQRVAILDPRGSLVGWGLFHPRSEIRVRLLRRGSEPADDAWLRERAAAAVLRRLEDPEVSESGDAWRVLHAEGDDFPGLTVDRFGDVLSAEAYTRGAVSLFETILPVLHEHLGTAHHRIAFAEARARAEGERAFERRSPDCPRRVKIREHGVRFEVDLEEGHKTGFFCDQRENRRRLAALARDRSVLDVCCYSGGFAVAAAVAGARSVLGVDLDEAVLPLARRNVHLNQQRATFVHADAFSYLRTLWRNERRFEVIVLDPPKFIPSRKEKDRGMARYQDLNKLALLLVQPGGWLLTCSCSGLLPAHEFQEILRRAANRAGRTVRLVETTGAGRDHPVRLDFPEGAYLKALWLRVEG